MLETRPHDLVQLTTMILEEALSRPVGCSRGPSPVKLITSTMSVLSPLLAIPSHSDRVRLCIRSTIALFGSDKSPEFASIALAAKRVTAIYDDPRVVAFRRPTIPQSYFIHSPLKPQNAAVEACTWPACLHQVLVEHLSWKYAQPGDRFEIGKRVASLYISVLESTPPLEIAHSLSSARSSRMYYSKPPPLLSHHLSPSAQAGMSIACCTTCAAIAMFDGSHSYSKLTFASAD